MGSFEQFNWKGKQILIVEDDKPSSILLTALLSRTGVKLYFATNGQQAVDIVKTNNSIDLILMDIKLEGMNGIQASTIIHEHNPNIPIIAQTACVMTGDRENCMAAGCVAYVSKPIDAYELLQIIDKYINGVKIKSAAETIP
ncbi:MAG: response regulator [Tenuifilum sp.]|uniref:response regulator n=3 Tax=Tenuifilum sp. TaxID=2760880 RepID=UPI002BFBB604|nr:response regulator [Tenuifilum sp.]HON71506.1 response regulator [Tenuifilum sp.]HPP90451.1 response regulator [Tenuifilum sp.]